MVNTYAKLYRDSSRGLCWARCDEHLCRMHMPNIHVQDLCHKALDQGTCPKHPLKVLSPYVHDSVWIFIWHWSFEVNDLKVQSVLGQECLIWELSPAIGSVLKSNASERTDVYNNHAESSQRCPCKFFSIWTTSHESNSIVRRMFKWSGFRPLFR